MNVRACLEIMRIFYLGTYVCVFLENICFEEVGIPIWNLYQNGMGLLAIDQRNFPLANSKTNSLAILSIDCKLVRCIIDINDPSSIKESICQ
jgi:hypothetical protein